MKIIESAIEMCGLAKNFSTEGESIGFVPTMGALHNGHISLLRKCRKENDVAVVSIFVNPLQFLKGEDYDKYPRQLALDKKICSAEEVDILFIPQVGSVYQKGFDTFIDQSHYGRFLCGPFRPNHFRGVMTVVAKFFNIVRPDKVYFGQKDYQQYLIVKRMVEDLNFHIEVKMLPTVREEDGLAISSRNIYLGPKQRKIAPVLYQSLMRTKELVAQGVVNVKRLKPEMIRMLACNKGLKVEYVEFANVETLEPVNEVKTQALVAVAVRLGNIRLIDNMIITRG
ncbi:MAG: pantoate--beta-alanine ligase [Planctomycetes bacterium]|nr:pantoate--beta-alanine ligase [Planctomycetota bacterium]